MTPRALTFTLAFLAASLALLVELPAQAQGLKLQPGTAGTAGTASAPGTAAPAAAPRVAAPPLAPTGGQRAADFIVAVVNSEPITNSEVRVEVQRLAQQYAQQRRAQPPRSELVQDVLERLQTGLTSANQRIMFQLEFVGYSRLGSNPLKSLKDNIPRYQYLREQTSSPSRFSNYD